MTSYTVGDKVFHPFYGAGTITHIQAKKIGGERRRYYIIDTMLRSMQLLVPVSRAETIGLRRVGKGEDLRRILQTFGEIPTVKEIREVARLARQDDMRELLKSGSFADILKTVQQLYLMHNDRPLATSDRELFDQCRDFLAGELALALGIEKVEAMSEIDNGLAEMMEKQEEVQKP